MAVPSPLGLTPQKFVRGDPTLRPRSATDHERPYDIPSAAGQKTQNAHPGKQRSQPQLMHRDATTCREGTWLPGTGFEHAGICLQFPGSSGSPRLLGSSASDLQILAPRSEDASPVLTKTNDSRSFNKRPSPRHDHVDSKIRPFHEKRII